MRMGKAFRTESLVVTLTFACIPILNKKKKMSYQALDIANKLLTRAKREESGELMSNLKFGALKTKSPKGNGGKG